jgi:hypothetical protein
VNRRRLRKLFRFRRRFEPLPLPELGYLRFAGSPFWCPPGSWEILTEEQAQAHAQARLKAAAKGWGR